MAFWTKLKHGVCCLDPFPFQACPEEKQKKKLSQGVKGFFMSRLFKYCYNWPGILRLRSSINSPWNVIWINVCIRTRSSWHCRYVFREGSLNKHIYPWTITLNIYCSWFILSSDNSRFLGCFRFFWTDLLHVGSGLLMLRFITSPNIALSRKKKGKTNVLNKLDIRNIAIKWI